VPHEFEVKALTDSKRFPLWYTEPKETHERRPRLEWGIQDDLWGIVMEYKRLGLKIFDELP
jgi:hypothetical protein